MVMKPLANSPTPNREVSAWIGRYMQFCVVGGSGVVVDMVVLWLLASPTTLAWDLSLSKVIAAEAAMVNNFLWNDAWTFRTVSRSRDAAGSRLRRFLKFNLICTAGIGLSVLLLNLQVRGLHWNVFLANFLAIVLVSVWNFFLSSRLGWRSAV